MKINVGNTIFENNNNKSDKIHRKSFVNHVKHGRTSYIMHIFNN